jgi:signal recognition particle receptor subunit beta
MKYKIIITGPVGSGKSTAVNTITGNEHMLTDASVSDSDIATLQRKKTTTVAMDYGIVPMRNNDVIHLYGTPGQERFDFMWDILAKGTDGLVLLLDNSRNNPFRDLKYYTNAFSSLIETTPFVLGITRTDVKNDPPLAAYKQWLDSLNIEARIVAIDAREKGDINHLLEHLIYPDLHPEPDHQLPEPEQVVPDAEVNADEKTTEEQDTTATDENNYIADETFSLKEESLEQIAQLKGVNGVTLSNAYGELLHSTIEDEDINDFIAFLSGITPSLEETAELGTINRIMLRSPTDDNLTVFVEKERALGISSERKTSIPALSQQVEDMLQWG